MPREWEDYIEMEEQIHKMDDADAVSALIQANARICCMGMDESTPMHYWLHFRDGSSTWGGVSTDTAIKLYADHAATCYWVDMGDNTMVEQYGEDIPYDDAPNYKGFFKKLWKQLDGSGAAQAAFDTGLAICDECDEYYYVWDSHECEADKVDVK